MPSVGNIYGWGVQGKTAKSGGAAAASAAPGQKKNFADQHVALPTRIKKVTGFIACSSYAEYSMALKSDGTVFTWGVNSRGRCGHPVAQVSLERPTKVP